MQNKIDEPEITMTNIREQPLKHFLRSACGRSGCVTVYRTDNCHLCDAVQTYLKDLLESEGLSEDIINTIDSTSAPHETNIEGVHSVPAVRVCQTVMTGLPDDERLRSSLRSASNKKCFLEDVTYLL